MSLHICTILSFLSFTRIRPLAVQQSLRSFVLFVSYRFVRQLRSWFSVMNILVPTSPLKLYSFPWSDTLSLVSSWKRSVRLKFPADSVDYRHAQIYGIAQCPSLQRVDWICPFITASTFRYRSSPRLYSSIPWKHTFGRRVRFWDASVSDYNQWISDRNLSAEKLKVARRCLCVAEPHQLDWSRCSIVRSVRQWPWYSSVRRTPSQLRRYRQTWFLFPSDRVPLYFQQDLPHDTPCTSPQTYLFRLWGGWWFFSG